jgi:quinol monooxygenase YgiN
MTTTIFANLEAKPEAVSQVELALRKMVPASRAEAGCVRYQLFRSEDKASTFNLLETYADDDALAAHHGSAHFAELVASLADKLVGDIQIERLASLED